MSINFSARAGLLVCTALASAAFLPAQAMAQDAVENDGTRLEDIVVTAQKREQNLQDVPIAVTALTEDTLVANRITTVSDLTGLAPGVTVRTAAGGSQLPSFAVRGAISYGVVPGSDKQVSIYIDGVYISSARGAIFDLPDISRIEMLRGPQGTLFGRNATAGAVSITTREPDGEFGVTASGTIGNFNINRERLSVNLPQMGAFSGYLSVTHEYKRGDIENANPGISWDRTAGGGGVQVSPRWLGTKNSLSFFGALKFAPSDDFKMVYRFDHNKQTGTPEGTGLVGINSITSGPNANTSGSPLLGMLVNAVLGGQSGPVYYAADGRRPKIVNNGFAVPSEQSAYGHNLTASWTATDNLSFKNVAAFRHSTQTNSSPIDGFSSLPYTAAADAAFTTALTAYFTPLLPFLIPNFSSIPVEFQPFAIAAALPPTIAATKAGFGLTVGEQFVGLGTQPQSVSDQWSNEFQANYRSDLMTVTAGALYFHSRERSGYIGLPGSVAFRTVPGGVITGNQGVNNNKATSLAAYAQVELHVTPQLDLVGGARITNDKKSGSLVVGLPTSAPLTSFKYEQTKPNFLLGVNYQPTDNILVYGKFSTSFVSGGSVSGLPFKPETARSFEAGIKADLLDRRLRANLAIYTVTYKDVQTAGLASNFPGLFPANIINSIGTIVISQGGPIKAKGFELELTAAPTRGVTLGGSLSYNETKFYDVNPVLIANSAGGFEPTLRAPWNGGVWGQFVSQPIAGDMTFMARVDASWHDMFYNTPNRAYRPPAFEGIRTVPASWNVNARVALQNINVGGASGELAFWVKNLTQNREATFALETLNLLGSANYTPARTFGADLTVKF